MLWYTRDFGEGKALFWPFYGHFTARNSEFQRGRQSNSPQPVEVQFEAAKREPKGAFTIILGTLGTITYLPPFTWSWDKNHRFKRGCHVIVPSSWYYLYTLSTWCGQVKFLPKNKINIGKKTIKHLELFFSHKIPMSLKKQVCTCG